MYAPETHRAHRQIPYHHTRSHDPFVHMQSPRSIPFVAKQLGSHCWRRTSVNNSHSAATLSYYSCSATFLDRGFPDHTNTYGVQKNETQTQATRHCVSCTDVKRDHTTCRAAGLLELKTIQILTARLPDHVKSPLDQTKPFKMATVRGYANNDTLEPSLLNMLGNENI